MAQPYIDCARRLAARGIKAEDISVCEVAEGTVHRLWEPLADKQRPRNGYAAKFATPYLLAAGFVHGGVGLGAFTEQAISDVEVLALAAKVKFVIDPDNPYPGHYTGHIRAMLNDGSVLEERQPHLRGGAKGAADPAGRDRQIRAQCRARRLGEGAERGGVAAVGRILSEEDRSECVARVAGRSRATMRPLIHDLVQRGFYR
jgi:2-methylcitrate dehydratase PrpD